MTFSSRLASLFPNRSQWIRLPFYLLAFYFLAAFSAGFSTDGGGVVSLWYLPGGLIFTILLLEGISLSTFCFLTIILVESFVFYDAFQLILVGKAFVTVAGYSAASYWMRKLHSGKVRLASMRDIGIFISVTGLSVTVVAIANASLNSFTGFEFTLPFIVRLILWWMGDLLAVLSFVPFALVHSSTIKRFGSFVLNYFKQTKREKFSLTRKHLYQAATFFLQILTFALVLWAAFYWPVTRQYHPFYLCFIPLVWITLVGGIEGATLGIVFINTGTIIAARLTGADLISLQFFVLIFTVSSLYLGSAISERRLTERALLLDINKLKEAERMQAALAQISESASTSENLVALLQSFHLAIMSVIPARNFYICLYNPDTGLLSFPYFIDEVDSTPEPKPLEHGLTEYVLRSGKPALVDPERFAELERSGQVISFGAPSIDWLGVPLKIQDLTIGVMAVQSYSEDVRFNQSQLDFLTLVAPRVAMAIEHKRAEEALQKQHDFIKTVFDSAPDAILTFDLNDKIIDCNQAAVDIFGFESKEEFVGQSATPYIHPDDLAVTKERLRLALTEGVNKSIEFRFLPKTGDERYVELNVGLIRDEYQNPLYFVGHLVDTTQRRQAEEALRISEERYSLAMLGAKDGLWDWDLNTNKVYYSQRWKSMLGYSDAIGDSPEEWLGRVHPDDLPQLMADINAHLFGSTPQLENEYRIRTADGSYRWMIVRGIAIRKDGERPHRLAGSQTDIHDRKIAEQQLIHDALHDALTELPNRVLFMDRLGQAIKRAARHPDSTYAVLFLDLDRFKVVNDSLGHLSGDEVLIQIARRLEKCLRSEDTVARLSGDEFAVLITELQDPTYVMRIASRIQQEIAQPIAVGGQQVFMTVSIGIALSGTGYETAEEVLRDADTAMYRAKAMGGDRHVVFDQRMHAMAVELLHLETDLRQALENNEFVVYYQPICSLRTGKVVAAEALLRWQHPIQGLRRPAEFIELAEETGLIVPIGEWILRTACRQLAEWHRQGYPHLKIAVNISARQFQTLDLPNLVSRVLTETGIKSNQLELEITERIDLTTSVVEEILNDLNMLGVRISIDDFGTGYSSLNTLKHLTISNIKIAQPFIVPIGMQKENDLILASIIQMAHNLGFEVVAEGVETPEQLNFLRGEGCDMIQGYYISPAVPADRFISVSESRAGRISNLPGVVDVPAQIPGD